MIQILQWVNLALRFFLELCALAALGYWGSHTGNKLLNKITLGVGAPLLWAVVWGLFGSPKATYPLSAPLHLLLEVVVFGVPAFALYVAGKPTLAIVYACLVVINHFLMFIWQQ